MANPDITLPYLFCRLEFLGDAILDFVVTQRIYRDHPNMDPGELTDLRIALVSNVNLAVAAVRLGIHKFLEHTDPNLWSFINNFSEAVSMGVSNIWKLEHDFNEREEMLSYKVLGDMLEAIIGAIFVDSGGVTSIVTAVIYRLLEREFEAYGKDLPVDPVRMMHELYPDLEVS
ncbi:Endoribonuclease Dcr-1 [Taenia solium]|eukprot:TsM_000048100 transcript=TsM_000048100 gene=TsM_000048100